MRQHQVLSKWIYLIFLLHQHPISTRLSAEVLIYHTYIIVDSVIIFDTNNLHLYCWGKNNYGELNQGHNNTVPRPTLCSTYNGTSVQVNLFSIRDFLVISDTDSNLYSVGNNVYGQLCTNDTFNRVDIVKIGKIGGINELIYAGPGVSFVGNDVNGVKNMYVCGRKNMSGTGMTEGLYSEFHKWEYNVTYEGVSVTRPSDWIRKITCNDVNCLMLDSNDYVFSWGGGLYLGREVENNFIPVAVHFGPGSMDIRALKHNFYIFKVDNFQGIDTVYYYAWGDNIYGQIDIDDYRQFMSLSWASGVGEFEDIYETSFVTVDSGQADGFVVFMRNIVDCYGLSKDYDNVCSGRAECVDFNNCSCNSSMYEGVNCERTFCYGINSTNSSYVCSGHGECYEYNKCKCNETEYGGDKCQSYKCFGLFPEDENVCSGNGNCTESMKCECEEGYHGYDCSHSYCYDISSTNKDEVCSGRGRCIKKDFCLCDYPDKWGGRECNIPKCNYVLSVDSKVCSGRGDCLLNNETLEYECVCDNKKKWKGKDCSNKIISEFEYTRIGLLFVAIGVICVIGGFIVFLLFFTQKMIERYLLEDEVEKVTIKKINKNIELKSVTLKEKKEEELPNFEVVKKLDNEILELEKILKIEEEGGDALEIEMKEEILIIGEIDDILNNEKAKLPKKEEIINIEEKSVTFENNITVDKEKETKKKEN